MTKPILTLDKFAVADHRVEVRCCCDGRLLGYLPDTGQRIVCPLRPKIASWEYKFSSEPVKVKPALVLTKELFTPNWTSPPYGAYKSRDYPLDQLRQIPGWQDASE